MAGLPLGKAHSTLRRKEKKERRGRSMKHLSDIYPTHIILLHFIWKTLSSGSHAHNPTLTVSPKERGGDGRVEPKGACCGIWACSSCWLPEPELFPVPLHTQTSSVLRGASQRHDRAAPKPQLATPVASWAGVGMQESVNGANQR